MNTRRYFLLLIAFLFLHLGYSQQTGKIEYKQLGISFEIPEGWVGQETNGLFVMASHQTPGIILLMAQEFNAMEQMQQQAQLGYHDANGTHLKPAGPIENLGNQSIGLPYMGTLEGQPAKAYVVGMINEFGHDALIMAVTTAQKYSPIYKDLALKVKNSITFTQPETETTKSDWNYYFSNVKLTHMDSYYSSSSSVGGISGGYESKKIIDLCSAGYFIYYGSNSMTVGGDFSSGYSAGRSQGNGTWETSVHADGTPVLLLNFNDGKIWEFKIEVRNKKLYLNGTRYYRTWTGDYAPSCN